MNINNFKKVYLIGIKGSGVVGIAEIFKKRGLTVLGSDTSEKFFTDEVLRKNEIPYFEEFSEEHIKSDIDLVVYSTAYNAENNVEFKRAKELELPMMSYPEILGELFNEKYGIAVCGTHGKTTTSAMLADVLKAGEKDPSAVIGSRVKEWEGNTLSGKGEFFVIEADEFQNKFQFYDPKAVILTSLDWDHPDFFKNFDEYKKAFKKFIQKVPQVGFVTVWGDSSDTLDVVEGVEGAVLTYGFSGDCDFQVKNIEASVDSQKFEVLNKGKSLGIFEIKLVGKHNVLNATSVIATCLRLGVEIEKIKDGLKNFQGTTRRFEYIGERNGAILIDDYGHHPEELKATLQAAKEIYPDKNIWAIFHPHSFTRTESLLDEFSQSFSSADKVIVLDIYGSARENQGKVSSADLVKLINKYEPNKAEYIPTISEAIDLLKDKIGKSDVVLSIGAGNVFKVTHKLNEK